MWIFYTLIILVLAAFAGAMTLFKYAVVRVANHTPEDQIDEFERERGMDVTLLRRGVSWYRAQPRETISITSFDGLRLAADYIPAEGTSRGRVLLFHGYHGGIEDYSAALPYYHSLGFDLLMVDERAHGRSEGKYIGYGVLEKRDCCAWAQEADRRWGEAPTFLAGVSMGAATVLMAAEEPLPADVRGIIADCGFTSPKEEICYVMRQDLHLPAYPMYWLVNGLCRLLAGYGFDDCSTERTLAKSDIPVLLIHGEADTYVLPEMSRKSYAACRGEKHLLMIPGAGHCQGYLTDAQGYERELKQFLLTHAVNVTAEI